MRELIKRKNIALQLLLLVFALFLLSFYNYVSQKRVFLQQLEEDSGALLQSVRSSVNKFQNIEKTLNLQQLVEDISLQLDIFEFRYLDRDGIVISSMFSDEIGRKMERRGAGESDSEPAELGKFYTEERDLTKVMAISYPVKSSEELVGIIDLAVDVSIYDYVPPETRNQVLRRMRQDIRNLLNAISGSIVSRLKVFHTVDMGDFLAGLVDASDAIVEINLLRKGGLILSSSDMGRIGARAEPAVGSASRPLQRGGEQLYLLRKPMAEAAQEGLALAIYIDATGYAKNERKLFYSTVATSLLGVVFALAIVYSIYRINLTRAREENLRLERMVQERTNEIERISKTDKLTGLANRCALEEKLDMEYKRATRYRHDLSLSVIDLDYFKRVNDNYGHLAGDTVLREVGQRLQNLLRDTDFIGRYGGEEFVVIFPETSLDDALNIAEKLRCHLAAEPVLVEGKALYISASLGVAALNPGHQGYKDIFAEADKALYFSKSSGRDRVSYLHDEKPVEYRGADEERQLSHAIPPHA